MMKATCLIPGEMDTSACTYAAKKEGYKICASLGYSDPRMMSRGHTCDSYHFRCQALAAIGRHDPVPYGVN